MSDASQIFVPPSFIALFVPPGRHKPTASSALIAERYELCEDLATLLVEHARVKRWDLQIDESDVLERIHQGLTTADATVDAAEARWVITRLAELLEWTPLSSPQG